MIDNSRVDEYLKRIEVDRPINRPNREYLIQLHLGHLTHIPFETFDLIDLKYVDISPDCTFDRLVRQNRGGICYQMNGLFASILQSFNYHLQLIPCVVYSLDKNRYRDVVTHVSLCVTLENDEKVLCDVGFGRDFLTPLFFQTDCIQYASNGFFRLTTMNDGLNYQLEKGVLEKNDDISLPASSLFQTKIIDINPELIKWTISYRFPIDFSERSVEIEDFKGTCPYVIHSPDVNLNHRSICNIYICQPFIGAYGITGKDFFETIIENGIEHRTRLSLSEVDDQELKQLLKEKFHILIERKLELVNR